MKFNEVVEKMKLLKTDRRYDIFCDLEYSNLENIEDELVYIILEHNKKQTFKELELQGLLVVGFVEDGYLHQNKKLYPVEAFCHQS